MTKGRHTRQIRLAEIGEAGQARLAGAEARAIGQGLAAAIAARYLAGAGVGLLVVPDDAAAIAARAVDASVHLRVAPSPDDGEAVAPPLGIVDDAARAVAEGAYRALAEIRRLTLEAS